MNCIDAIEGTAKEIIDRIQLEFGDTTRDDSEYVRAVKSVIDGAERFVTNNPEIYEEPKLFGQVLYRYAKQLWLSALKSSEDLSDVKDGTPTDEDTEYHNYYYDFLYDYGIYPP